MLRESYFSESVDLKKTKQNKSRLRLLGVATYKTCAIFQGKMINPTPSPIQILY